MVALKSEEMSIEELTSRSPTNQKKKHVFLDESSSSTESTMTDPSSSLSLSDNAASSSSQNIAASRRSSCTRHVQLAIDDDDDDDDSSSDNNEEEKQQQGGTIVKKKKKKKIKGVEFHESEPLSEDEFQAYFTTPEDSQRFDSDVKKTIHTWVEYKKGNIADFDEDEYTMRGLEELLDHMRCKNNPCNQKVSRQDLKTAHIEKVLQEVNRQKRRASTVKNSSGEEQSSPCTLDAEQLRRVSMGQSEDAVKQAIKIAQKDEAAARAAFENDTPPTRRQSAPDALQNQEQEAQLPPTSIRGLPRSTENFKQRRKSMFSFINRKNR